MSLYTHKRGRYKKSPHKRRLITSLIVVALVVLCYSAFRSLSSGQVSGQSSFSPEALNRLTKNMPWPSYGQSAFATGISNFVAVSSDDAKPVPIASTAKIITAIAVLNAKPLQPGEQGPLITLTQEDVALYENYVRNSGSVAYVEAGEQISEYQALEAMLLPSSNNHADSLVRWAFGSMENYVTYANNMLQSLGLKDTVVADASGFSPQTKSTAHDMALLGVLYVKTPVLKEIATKPKADIPLAGIVKNYNDTVNKDGVLGIKVGNTDEAGRCFVLAAENGDKTTVSVVLGAEHIDIAMRDAVSVIRAGNAAYASSNEQ